MRRLPSLSPDVIVPGEAKRKSRAQTPSGQGRGWADDEQTYRRAAKLAGKDDSTPPDVLILSAANNALAFIEHNAGRWKDGNDWRVTEAIEALRILKEWLERRG